MKTVTFIQNAQAVALARTATVKGDRVTWNYSNYVSFRKQGGHVVIKTVNDDFSLNVIMFNDGVKDLGGDEVNMVMAAMIVLGVTAALVGNDTLIMAVNTGPEVIIVREERQQRPATSWDTAVGFTLSQHRPEHEERTRRTTRISYETSVPKITLPKTRLGWVTLGVAAVTVATVAVIAASVTEQ